MPKAINLHCPRHYFLQTLCHSAVYFVFI